jgi:hypothetical protein
MRTTRAAGVLAALAVLAGCAGPATVPVPAPAASPSSPSPSSAPAVPDTLLLPDEGGRSRVAEFTDWTTDRTLDRAWLLDPCRPTAYPTDRQRTRFRTVSREGPEAQDARQLGEYPTPDAAAEVLAGFRRALDACRTGRADHGATWTWVTADAPDLGDDGFLAASAFVGPQYASHGDRIAVTRAGSAVFLAFAGGEYYTAELDGGAQAVREVAQRFLESL